MGEPNTAERARAARAALAQEAKNSLWKSLGRLAGAADAVASDAMRLRALQAAAIEAGDLTHGQRSDGEHTIQIGLALGGICVQATALANEARTPNHTPSPSSKATRQYRVRSIQDDTAKLAALQVTPDL